MAESSSFGSVYFSKELIFENKWRKRMESTQESLQIKTKLGVKLKKAREKQELSLQALANSVGLSQSYLSDIERGRKYPNIDKLLRLSRRLEIPYEQLISSHEDEGNLLEAVLDALPSQAELFSAYGAKRQDFAELVMRHPTMLNAVLKSLVKIAHAHDFKEVDFFYALLNTYLEEKREEFFGEIEKAVEEFRQQRKRLKASERFIGYQLLKEILKEEKETSAINFELNDTCDFGANNPLNDHLRSIRIPEKNLLLVNYRLNDTQKAFQVAREIGYRVLGLQDINPTSPPLGKVSFLHLWDDLKASSFAGALLMRKELVQKDTYAFFQNEQWSEEKFRALIALYGVAEAPEMFLYRLHPLLPEKPFELKQSHFLRFLRTEYPGAEGGDRDKGRYELSAKSLNAGVIPFSASLSAREKYCRRFLAIRLLRDLAHDLATGEGDRGPRVGAQRSILLGSEQEFLCLTVARPLTLLAHPDAHKKPQNQVLVSVTLGFSLDEQLKKTVRFWKNLANMEIAYIGSTCERCHLERVKGTRTVPIQDPTECSDYAPGTRDQHLHKRESWRKDLEENLDKFLKEQRLEKES
jgi:transcriptional regulator with XRE-family HTH domain